MMIPLNIHPLMKLHMTKICGIFLVTNDFCSVEKAFEKVKPIPNLVLRLENFFDIQDKFRSVPNCKTNSSQMKYETINLGTELNPQTVNLGIDYTPTEKSAFIKLFK